MCCRGQKKVLDFLKLEFKVFVSFLTSVLDLNPIFIEQVLLVPEQSPTPKEFSEHHRNITSSPSMFLPISLHRLHDLELPYLPL